MSCSNTSCCTIWSLNQWRMGHNVTLTTDCNTQTSNKLLMYIINEVNLSFDHKPAVTHLDTEVHNKSTKTALYIILYFRYSADICNISVEILLMSAAVECSCRVIFCFFLCWFCVQQTLQLDAALGIAKDHHFGPNYRMACHKVLYRNSCLNLTLFGNLIAPT